MTQATQGNITLPNDGSNTGKESGAIVKVIGADTIYQTQVVPERRELVHGTYRCVSSGVVSVNATAQNGTTTGFLWLFLDSAATHGMRLRKFRVEVNNSAITPTMPTIPALSLSKFTHVGTPSGAVLTPVRNDTTAGVAQTDIRTAMTGLTVTLAGNFAISPIPAQFVGATVISIVSQPNAILDLIDIGSVEDEWPVIRPGEGIVMWQSVAATTSDTRRFTYQFMFDEFEV